VLRKEIIQKLQSEINKECHNYCSDKEPSILRKCTPEDIIAFSEKKCEEELKMKAPLLHSCMHAVAVSQKRQKKIEEKNEDLNIAPQLSMAASILLRHRCPQMSALAYRFSLGVLWHSGAKKQVHIYIIKVLSKINT